MTPTNEEFAFLIGGTHDGEKVKFEGLPVIERTRLSSIPIMPLMENTSDTVPIDREIYRGEILRTETRIFHFYVCQHISLDGAIERLFERYAK